MAAVVLDSEAVNALFRTDHPRHRAVGRYLEAARRTRRPVIVPTLILAELYRSARHNATVDASVARTSDALLLRDIDRRLARFVGAVLAAADAGSEALAGGHVVAAAAEAGGGVVVTGDPADLRALAAPYRMITVDAL